MVAGPESGGAGEQCLPLSRGSNVERGKHLRRQTHGEVRAGHLRARLRIAHARGHREHFMIDETQGAAGDETQRGVIAREHWLDQGDAFVAHLGEQPHGTGGEETIIASQ